MFKKLAALLAFLIIVPAFALGATQNSSNNVAAAGSLTGSTLASNVLSSSLTSVGTLANLTVTNPISGSVTGTAANLSGTPALPNGTTATTQSGGDNSGKIATDAFVQNAVSGGGLGTVTNVSVVTNDGVSGSVANPTSTPAITLTLGDLTATSLSLNSTTGTQPTPPANTVLELANAAANASRLSNVATAAAAYYTTIRQDGTIASPTTLQSGDEMGGYNAWGFNGSAFVGPAGAFRIYATQNWTGAAQGTYADIATTPNGATSQAEVIRFENDAGITVPSTVTGGDKGAGTINAAGLYVNGVAVSTGGASFSGLTSGTNTTAAMVVGSGATLGTSGSGTITATAVPASGITGTTLASNVVTTSATTVGTLIGGATGSGFTVALGTSTITGTLAPTNGGLGANESSATGVVQFSSGTSSVSTALANGTTATTQTTSDNTTKVATDAFVQANIQGSGVRTVGFSSLYPVTGQQGTYWVCPISGTITGWAIAVDAGTATVQTWKVAAGTASPTSGNSISTAGVQLTTGTMLQSTTLTDFTTTTVTAGDTFAFNLSAVSGVTRILFQIEITPNN